MHIDLSGRTALVTGSTQGIGLAIATQLGRAGAEVIVNGRRRDRTEAAADEVRAETGAKVQAVAADVTTDEGTETLLAAVRLIRAYLPAMMEEGWGRIQNIASDSAIVIPAEMIHYGMTKTALLAVSRGFAKEAAGTGVTVNSVIAGPTHTGGVEDFVYQLVDKSLPWDEAQREFMRVHRPQSLLQRLIEPEEIANLVAYLASPLASATTGAAVRVDGGYVDSIIP